jgi:DNA-binding transcriptional ArsR family regulator
MKQFEVNLALKALGDEMKKWKVAYREAAAESEKILTRLIHEAIANRMSVEQIAEDIWLTPATVRMKMRRMGLDPKRGKTALAESAAKALRENADLLGVDPLDIDLTSPLAYLPMGSQLRQQLQSDAVKGVKDLPEEHVCSEYCQLCRERGEL